MTAPATAAESAVVSTPTRAVRPQRGAGPAVLGVANAGTIAAATAAHLIPGVGLALVAAGAVGYAGLKAARLARGNRRLTGSAWRMPRSRSAGLRLGGLGRASSPRLGRLPGLGRLGGTASPSAGRRTAGLTLARRGGMKQPKTAAAPSSRGTRTASRPVRTGLRLPRRAGRQPGLRISDAVRAAVVPGQTGARPSVRQAAAAARRAMRAQTVRRGRVRRVAAGLGASIAASTLAGWRRMRNAGSRTVTMSHRPAGTPARRRRPQPRVGTAARRPAGQTPAATAEPSTTLTPAAKPAPTAAPPGATTPAPTGGSPVSARQLIALSEDMLAAALRDQPDGMIAVSHDAHLIPQVIENIAMAMKIRYDRAQTHPLHPSIQAMYAAVHKAQLAVLGASREIGPAIERIHKHELDRLRQPRRNEQMWDVQANKGAV
ncbi:MAG TPA: hypothetical protein VFE14_10665 [Micromonosporaceae bacterium]|nr:hypothetical protein [Micromonosporaceae bacterium]